MKHIQEPSKNNKPIFTKKLAEEILIELDGWQLIDKEDIESSESEEPFIDTGDEKQLKNVDSNHKLTIEEVEHFFDKSFEEALNDTNRYDINDLDDKLVNFFMLGVIKLTASNLWIKYNTSVTVDNEEGIIDYGQGGKLYKKYQNIIENFVKGVRVQIEAV